MRTEDRDVDIEPDDTLSSVEVTMRFLALCDRYGSHEAEIAAVSQGWRAGAAAGVRPAVSTHPDLHARGSEAEPR